MTYVSVHVDLDSFDEDDLVDHLEGLGYTVTEKSGKTVYSSGYSMGESELNRIEHLIICGMTDVAKKEALGYVCKAIGRTVAPIGWVTE